MELDARVRSLVEQGRSVDAVELIVRSLAPELSSFQRLYVREDALADDALGALCEKLLATVGRFDPSRGELRAWLYAIARTTALDVLRGERRHRRGRTDDHHLESVAAIAREVTQTFRRTETKSVLEEIRAGLDPDDRALLALRVSANRDWREIAAILSPDREVTREAARLRKRFERLKHELRSRMIEAGLLDGER